MVDKSGVLVDKHLREAVNSRYIYSPNGVQKVQIQPSSLDLTLSDEGYRVEASFLPHQKGIRDQIGRYRKLDLSSSDGALIEPRVPYMIRLSERLRLPKDYHGKTNPKSSTGRDGVFSRVVIDGHAPSFDTVPHNYSGDLWIQVISNSFPIILREGMSLAQLRLYYKDNFVLSDSDIKLMYGNDPLVYKNGKAVEVDEAIIKNGVVLSVDLKSDEVVGYRAKRGSVPEPLDLDRKDHYDPRDYFDPILLSKNNEITVGFGEFLILSSQEALKVPPEYASEIKPFGHEFGDLRSHYAGFFDPGWGYGKYKVGKGKRERSFNGTRATLEVIAMESALKLRHGQPICSMEYERCLDIPEETYGATAIRSHYQKQKGATLSKRFKRVA